jgi:hypothetical protein
LSNKVPFFLTGANAKIILNNKTLAFATDVSYRISVKHASPRVLGRFEVEVHQPLSYDVTGSLTIIRYARGLTEFNKNQGYTSPEDASRQGDGVGSMTRSSFAGAVGSALGLPTADGQFDGKANEAFVPSRMYQSSMFDIEIRQKLSNGEDVKVVLLRDCRIEESQFTLTKKGVATETLTFKARYADDDSAIARKSGVGQELS